MFGVKIFFLKKILFFFPNKYTLNQSKMTVKTTVLQKISITRKMRFF